MKKIIVFLSIMLLSLTSCSYLVETIYDGASITELNEIADYHFTALVEEKTDSKVEIQNGIPCKFDYYRLKIKENYKGETSDEVTIRYAISVKGTSDLIIGEIYHFYCSKTDDIYKIDSPNAQCYSLEEYETELEEIV